MPVNYRPRRRGPQEIEIFQMLHFTDVIRPDVEARFAGQSNVSKSERMQVTREIAQRYYSEASEEVKVAVRTKATEGRLAVQMVREEQRRLETEDDGLINPVIIQQ